MISIHSRALFRVWCLVSFSFPCLLPAAVEVQIGLNFTGSTLNLNSLSTPADANGTVGPDHFVELINGRYAVYDKTNGTVEASKTDKGFWMDAGVAFNPGLRIADPRLVFDPLSSRWFACAIDGDSGFNENRLLLAVSQTSNPLDGWNGVAFDPDPVTSLFTDFPTLGIDANGVYLAANFFSIGGASAVGKTAIAIPKAGLLELVPSIDGRTSFGMLPAATGGQTLQPVVSFAPTATEAHLLGQGPFITRTLRDTTISNVNSPGLATLNPTTSISVPAYSPPGNIRQPDGTTTLRNIDTRLGATVYEVGGVLFAVQATQVGGRSAIRWYRVDAASDTLLEAGTISDPNLDFSYPSIAANEDGVIVIGFDGSGLTRFVSSYAIVGETVFGVTTFGAPLLLKEGVANYHYAPINGVSRWGDYSATSVDPEDSTRFWTIQQYVSAPDVWSTQITELRIIPEPFAASLLGASVLFFLVRGSRRR